jgi:hypothetical protein
MPITTQQFTLAENVRQRIVVPDVNSQHVCIHNHEHQANNEIFLGNSGVTLANGMHAVATQTSIITLGPNDDLYAIANDDCNLRIMVVTQD